MPQLLYAEDDDDFRATTSMSMELYFKKHHIDVNIDETNNGEQLLSMAISGNYDLIITDNTMPKMTGLEAIKKIRETNISIPIYMLAGGEETTRQTALDLGADGYIEKDEYYWEQIEEVLNKHFTKS